MKKILIFSLSYYPKHIGGAEVALKAITDRLPTDEFEFHLVCNRYDMTLPKEEKMGNVIVHRIGLVTQNPSMSDLQHFPLKFAKYLFQVQAALVAMSLHKKYSFDATWAMMAHSCGIPAALFKTRYPTVPYVLTLQEGDPPEYIEKLARPVWPLFKRAFTKADTIQTISHFLAAWAKKMGFSGEPAVVPNAVNIAHFSQTYTQEQMEQMRQTLGKKEGDVFLITTSRLVHKNACDDVINALTHLPETIHFVILGIGPDEEKLRSLAHTKNLEHRVHFLGQKDHRELPLYLKSCDIFIRPSRSEGMGNSFVEAMAARLPVVATQEGGIADFLFDEKRDPEKATTGWAVDANSPQQIADAILDICNHPQKVVAVTQTAYELAVTQYDWDLIARDMREKVFMSLFKL